MELKEIKLTVGPWGGGEVVSSLPSECATAETRVASRLTMAMRRARAGKGDVRPLERQSVGYAAGSVAVAAVCSARTSWPCKQVRKNKMVRSSPLSHTHTPRPTSHKPNVRPCPRAVATTMAH
jgi:hypothetical protein